MTGFVAKLTLSPVREWEPIVLTAGDDTMTLVLAPYLRGPQGPVGPMGPAAVWGLITGTLSAQTDLQNALNAKVPATRTVNAHALSADITLTAADVGAPAGSGTSTGTNTGDQDLSGLVPKTTTVNGHALSANVTVTKGDVGLSAVENKSSATIRSEITSGNVTTALGYTPEDAANKGVANGYASLDNTGKLPQSQLPSIALTEYLGAVASQAAMLALVGQAGDWCTRTDQGTNWVITGSDPTQLSSWTELSYPAAPVLSVAGRVGNIILAAVDISDSSATGRAILTGDAAGGRTALGLGSAALANDTDAITEGVTNLYFTVARVRATVLTGLSLASSAVISATDTVLSALGKLQGQASDLLTQVTAILTSKGAASGIATLDAASKVTLTQTRTCARTAVVTGAYNANGYELVPIDASAGNVPVNLPNAPEDRTRVEFKLIAVGAGFSATISTQGADVFNKAAGATSLSLSTLNQAAVIEYDAPTKVWTIVSADITLTASDARYSLKPAYVALPDAASYTPALVANDTTLVSINCTQAAGTLTANNPTGTTPANGALVSVLVTCTNAQTAAFGTAYRGTDQTSLPAAYSGGGKTDQLLWRYDATPAKYSLVSINFGA